MNPVAIFEIFAFLATLVALIILWSNWERAFRQDTRLLFAGLLVLTLFVNFSNVLEWSGITRDMDTLEDYVQILAPLLWVFFFYAFIQEAAAQELRESRERFRSLVEVTSDWIWEVDANATYTYASPNVKNFLGYEPREVIGKTPFDFMPSEEANRVAAEFNAIKEARRPFSGLENLNRHKEGRLVTLETSGVPIFDNKGTFRGYRGIDRDITERRLMEEEREKMQMQLFQSQKMEAIGILAGGVAHDFNNLLTTIQGYTEVAMLKVDGANPIYRDLNHIHYASIRAAELTRQLLLFSRKQPPMELTPLNLNRAIKNSLEMFRRLIGEDIAIDISLGIDLLAVCADAGSIDQVIMNLVVNARDAMPDGGKITIKTENVTIDKEYCTVFSYAQPGEFVCLSVADTGVGMDKETIQHAFEPFFSTKKPGKGTGLGLPVVYGIVKQHGGWINVYSESGLGSTFNVYFPAVFIEPEEKSDEAISLQELQGRNERILLVEDEESVREFAAIVLGENGYVVVAAADAKEALDIFEKEKEVFHLILSDVVLPDQSGLQLVDKLLLRKPDVRILLCSGYMDEKSQWPVINEKGFRFIQKPYTLVNLLRAVREAIEPV
ncbi:MAG: PAS domain S-box protein [Deltaproteobacteria bacterium]|nr:MAG: PAS domain S-box protein [Deltaproteobacteria bacterium]